MDRYQFKGKDQALTERHYTAWQLIKLYWQSEEYISAYLFTIAIVLMTVSIVGLIVALTYWYNFFYNALQAYQKQAVWRLVLVFCALAATYMVINVYRYYISSLFALRWRKWLTAQFIERWLKKRGYYYLENFDEKTDNPDQRIQEDINALVTNSIALFTGLISSITTILGFTYVLWQLSGEITIPLGPLGSLRIPGYLVWVGILYALAGTYFTFKLGRPLVGLNFEQQRREANFRFAAVDLRSHAEHIALYRGEQHQKNILQRIFSGVLENWYFIILRQKLLLWFTSGYNQLSVILPLLVALPNYFRKFFQLGGLMQTVAAFDRVQDALSFLVNSFTEIAQWRAVTQRLTTFVNHLEDIEEKADKENKLIVRQHPEDTIVAKDVSISTPQGEQLLENIDEKFIHGKNYLIKGVSGIGKSTFVRTLAGIWPFASGEVIFPKTTRIMYLPQKPYMPIGTLAEAILFPDKTHPELEQHLEKVLRDCRLENFIPRIKETAFWSEQMSPGEQQRVGFARVLLHKPDWVFLDESTSMLDLGNEEYLYKLLKQQLPNCSVVSVGHRPSLDTYHEHVIDIEKYSDQKQPLNEAYVAGSGE